MEKESSSSKKGYRLHNKESVTVTKPNGIATLR
jgi:hypothetical protein